jgi:hypothetical protein
MRANAFKAHFIDRFCRRIVLATKSRLQSCASPSPPKVFVQQFASAILTARDFGFGSHHNGDCRHSIVAYKWLRRAPTAVE